MKIQQMRKYDADHIIKPSFTCKNCQCSEICHLDTFSFAHLICFSSPERRDHQAAN